MVKSSAVMPAPCPCRRAAAPERAPKPCYGPGALAAPRPATRVSAPPSRHLDPHPRSLAPVDCRVMDQELQRCRGEHKQLRGVRERRLAESRRGKALNNRPLGLRIRTRSRASASTPPGRTNDPCSSRRSSPRNSRADSTPGSIEIRGSAEPAAPPPSVFPIRTARFCLLLLPPTMPSAAKTASLPRPISSQRMPARNSSYSTRRSGRATSREAQLAHPPIDRSEDVGDPQTTLRAAPDDASAGPWPYPASAGGKSERVGQVQPLEEPSGIRRIVQSPRSEGQSQRGRRSATSSFA